MNPMEFMFVRNKGSRRAEDEVKERERRGSWIVVSYKTRHFIGNKLLCILCILMVICLTCVTGQISEGKFIHIFSNLSCQYEERCTLC